MGNTLPALITQQLKDVGITAEFTDTGNNFIADLLAPKYGVSYMILEQQSDWQLINMKIAPVPRGTRTSTRTRRWTS
ncbi:hypothetical protein AHiyo8_30810 [Arthrobacter sp. Hiyo8]|nr:hypothetical protein AHiyo8_30810 [Arthrobacter sp. Hiyo8]